MEPAQSPCCLALDLPKAGMYSIHLYQWSIRGAIRCVLHVGCVLGASQNARMCQYLNYLALRLEGRNLQQHSIAAADQICLATSARNVVHACLNVCGAYVCTCAHVRVHTQGVCVQVRISVAQA
jgi:hypothetical protein